MSRTWALLTLLALPVIGVATAETSEWPTKRSSDTSWGKDLYAKHCWQCHGRQAEGDGPAAEALQVPVPTLRAKSNPDTRGDLVAIARQGRGPMPAYHESISRDDMRRVFVWIESLDDPKRRPSDDDEDEDGPSDEEGNAPDPEGGE